MKKTYIEEQIEEAYTAWMEGNMNESRLAIRNAFTAPRTMVNGDKEKVSEYLDLTEPEFISFVIDTIKEVTEV
jgi:hypothetical protein